jgi:hypothetical protein
MKRDAGLLPLIFWVSLVGTPAVLYGLLLLGQWLTKLINEPPRKRDGYR